MPGIFLSKKQKAQMRERRQKLQKIQKEKGEFVPKKRKHEEQQAVNAEAAAAAEKLKEPQTIIVPADLDTTAARKFRKDARRKARQDGIDESLVTFLVEGQEEVEEEEKPRKKKAKRSFPCINDLLKEQKDEKVKQDQEATIQRADDALPDEYKSRYVGLDCEMVGIGADGKQSALARVSLVDWYGKPLIDTYVQVPSRVTDFRTHVSGVTAKHIQDRAGAMQVKACREKVASLLKGKVLVGHALHNDLTALLLTHPKDEIRDTAKYRPFQRVAGTKWRPRKLRDLVKQHLNLDIQVAGESHDSVEDASATMDLFKRVRDEWEKELEANQKKIKKKR